MYRESKKHRKKRNKYALCKIIIVQEFKVQGL